MTKHIEVNAIFPEDEILLRYIKLLSRRLEKEGFALTMEHRDPNGVDVFTFQSAEKGAVSVSRAHNMKLSNRQELRASSDWQGLADALRKTADDFGNELKESIEKGLPS